MTRLKWMISLFVFCCLRPAFAQGPHNSANSCPEPAVDHSHWRFLGRNPVGKPIRNQNDLIEFLAPTQQGGQKLYNKPWQQIAHAEWKLSEEALQRLYIEAGQGNFTREMVPPCALLGDMIYDNPPMVLGRAILADWEDKTSKPAWVYELDGEVSGTKGKLKMYFFEGCSNPSYQFIAETKKTEVTVPPPPKEKPKPSPQAETAPPPVVCPQCPPPVDCPAVRIQTYASAGSRFFGSLVRNWPELGLSIIAGAGASAAASSESKRLQAAYQSAGYSAGAYYIAGTVNPEHDRARVAVRGERRVLNRGGRIDVLNGRAEWDNGSIRVYQQNADSELLCGSAQEPSKFNFTPVPIVKRVVRVEKAETVQGPPGPQGPPGQCFVLVAGELKPCFTPPPNTSRPMNP